MADPQDLLRLADEVEKATGPDREMDLIIWFAVTNRPFLGFVREPNRHGLPETYDWFGKTAGNRSVSIECAPKFTASLDAAMTLIDGHGVLMHLSDIGADGLPLARVGVPGPDDAPIFTSIASCIMTKTAPVAGIAIALCAAALKARAHSTEESDNG